MTTRHCDDDHQPCQRQPAGPGRRRLVSRRRFIQAAVAAALLGGCGPRPPSETAQPTPSVAQVPPTAAPETAQPTPSVAEVPPPVTATVPAPEPTRTVEPVLTPSPRPEQASRVAIAQAESYEPTLIRQQVRALLDGIGGLSDVVSSGDRVAIKVNLTGGNHFSPPPGLSATESYLTHPEVVHALGELLQDAGAREILIVEALYDAESYRRYRYEEVAAALGATLVDLDRPHPYDGFASVPVGEGWFVYEAFTMNRILQEVDAFVSVSKMKCHCRCGVTHSMKNLIGLVPVAHYRLGEQDWWRSALHGSDAETTKRLPRVVIDLNRARPIHLALIDGIKTGQGGEVPRGSFAPLAPGVLFAGKDPVATDAVATAAMGFDPTVDYPAEPFVNGDNHLNLAYELGLGTNRLGEIEVVGGSIQDVQRQFAPCYSETGLRPGDPFWYV
jgi:uncharacterized protein (DUF362 family)